MLDFHTHARFRTKRQSFLRSRAASVNAYPGVAHAYFASEGGGHRRASWGHCQSLSNCAFSSTRRQIGAAKKARFGAFFAIYFVGSGVSFTVSQFLSARLIFSLSFLRHSVL
jgi:hypothetical protein